MKNSYLDGPKKSYTGAFELWDILGQSLGADSRRVGLLEHRLLDLAPVGLTIVDPDGRVAYINRYQGTFAACPWRVAAWSGDMYEDARVPRVIRLGLRRIARLEAPPTVVQVPPVRFAETGPKLDTFLVPIHQDGQLLGIAIAQYEREMDRVQYGPVAVSAAGGVRETGHPTAAPRYTASHGPPPLDILRLREMFGLTEREILVVDGLCRGRSSPEIGQTMGISRNTVKDYIKRIQRKLGAKNRLTIVALALQASLQGP